MVKLTTLLSFFTFLFCSSILHAQLTSGDIAIIGFNADSSDNLALVPMVDIPANTTLYIRDDEWNGTTFTTGEGTLRWTSETTIIPAGTIIHLNNLSDSAKRVANIGIVKQVSTSSFDISGANEAVFIYQASSQNTPTSFLSVIMNGPIASSATALTATGLVEGTTAVVLTAGVDIAMYTGPRTGLTKEAYLIEINKATNWTTQDGTGNQSTDGVQPDLPFASTAFNVSKIDNIPPSVFTANMASATGIKLIFSEKMKKESVENKANYSFSPALNISAISYDTIYRVANLTVVDLVSGKKYKLTGNSFEDLAGNKQTTASVFDNLYFNTYAGSDLVITEIMYNLGTGDSLEFVELYNKGTMAIPLGGLTLDGLEGILPERLLAAKEAVVLASDTVKANSFYGIKCFYDWEEGNLDNAGERIGIKNSLANLLDTVLYDDAAPWVTTPDNGGTSLEIIDPEKDNSVSTNWRASTKPLNKSVSSRAVFCSPGVVSYSTPIKEIPKELDYNIYPNPVKDSEIFFSKEISGFIADNMGRIILKFDKQTHLDIKNLQNGIYFIKTKDLEKRIIVQR